MSGSGSFLESRLDGKLNGTFDSNSPSAGGTAYGNSNTLSSNLNGRVIQMVIAKNLTLAQAWGILDLARTQNGTGNVTAFPFFATSEFYTLGLSWEVSKLAANTSVVNGGNWTVQPPPPPPNLWQLFWNTVAGFAAYVWNAAVAVGAFFVNVGKWLATAFISVVKGLTTGDWNDFKNQVLKPLADALAKFIKWVFDQISAILNTVFAPIIDAYLRWRDSTNAKFARVIKVAHDGSTEHAGPQYSSGAEKIKEVSDWVDSLLLVESILFSLVVGLAILEIFSKFVPSSAIVDKVVPTIISMIVLTVVVSATESVLSTFLGNPIEIIPVDVRAGSDWVFTIEDMILTIALMLKNRANTDIFKKADKLVGKLGAIIRGLKNVLWSLLVLSLAATIPGALSLLGMTENTQAAVGAMVILDFAALMIAVVGVGEIGSDKVGGRSLPLTKAVGEGLGALGIALSVTSLLADLVKYRLIAKPG